MKQIFLEFKVVNFSSGKKGIEENVHLLFLWLFFAALNIYIKICLLFVFY